MNDILKLTRIQLLVLLVFIISKLIRPYVLKADGLKNLKLFLLSFPNLCEAIIGVLILTGIAVYLNRQEKYNYNLMYSLAICLTAVYVSTQELKIHNLGGNNVYDPNDLVYSAIGLCIGAAIVFYIKPKQTR